MVFNHVFTDTTIEILIISNTSFVGKIAGNISHIYNYLIKSLKKSKSVQVNFLTGLRSLIGFYQVIFSLILLGGYKKYSKIRIYATRWLHVIYQVEAKKIP